MHVFDIVFLCLTVVVVIIGVRRGLITEAFRFASVVAGFAAASALYRQAFDLLDFLALSSGVKVVIAFVTVFVAAAAVVLAAGWVVKKVVHLTVLGNVDRVCGGCIGLLKCALVAWVVTVVLGVLPAPGLHRRLENSVVYSVCSRLPLQLRIPGMRAARRSLEGMVSHESIAGIPEKLEEFRTKVDSVKHNGR
ncbi:MAG: hypothetical protein GF331_04255 [Chitinivibrionales bacterium]|nr:hypothetical protein [Chitinivibrionales bacterium]